VTLKKRDNTVVALTAPLVPSVADIVNVNSPSSAGSALGVIVKTLSACDIVVVDPSDPDVIA
jgi:hypothetical protein